jgi:CHC2 zinc finger
MQADDPRLAEAKARPIEEVVHLLGIQSLKRQGHELVGPCPQCGGTDRFGVNLRKGVFQCRVCGIAGDGIRLVEVDRVLDFKGALTWLCGEVDGISDTERRARAERAREAKRKADAEAAEFRRRSVAAARVIWKQGVAPEGTAVEAYLARRSIDFARVGGIPKVIRFHPTLGYTVEEGGNQRRLIHRGPAMLCAVQGPDGRFSAVHRTWLDLDQPKGKAVITDPQTGKEGESKKVLGSKKGGAIRLTHTRVSDALIMGEGVETTASAWMADPTSGAMHWAGVDLGNMAGRQERVPGTRHSGLPDLDDAEAFLPPLGVTRLVYVQDGDSEPKSTRAKLEAGLRRAMKFRPGLRGQIARAPDGKDLNDVLMGVG